MSEKRPNMPAHYHPRTCGRCGVDNKHISLLGEYCENCNNIVREDFSKPVLKKLQINKDEQLAHILENFMSKPVEQTINNKGAANDCNKK